MAKCDACGSSILFGGKQAGDLRFCNATCQARGGLLHFAAQLPPEQIEAQARLLHGGPCPLCNGPGPVDVHTAHLVWSVVVLTSWKSTPHLACRGCGRKKQAAAAAISLVAGWWGFPWGLIFTPVQLTRDVIGIVSGPDPREPSRELRRIAKLVLAQQLAARPQPPPLPVVR